MRLFLLNAVLCIFVCIMPHNLSAEDILDPSAQGRQDFIRTLEETYHSNPRLKAARAELRATHELLSQAFSGWRPSAEARFEGLDVDSEGSNFGGGNTPEGTFSKDYTVAVTQPLYRGGRNFAQTDIARQTILAQRAQLDATEQDVLRQAVAAYMAVVEGQKIVQLRSNNRDVIDRQSRATKIRFEVGELTKTDVSQSEARLARAESDLIVAQGELKSAEATFQEITGLKPLTLDLPQMDYGLPETLEDSLSIAAIDNPSILAAQYLYRASKDGIDDAYGELLPIVSLIGQYNKTIDPQPGLIDESEASTVGITATMPLYLGGAARSRVRQAKEETNQKFMTIQQARREVEQAVIANWELWQAAQAESRSRRAQVEASRIAQEGVTRENEVGSRTVLDVLDAEQEFLDAETSLISAQSREVVAAMTLLQSLGRLTPDHVGFETDDFDYDAHLKDVSWRIFSTNVPNFSE